MKRLTRRQFNRWLGASALAAGGGLLSAPAIGGGAKPKVVVVGGGAGGATAARRLAVEAGGLEVTLVEPNRSYTAIFFANRYLGGVRNLDEITHGYERLAGAPALTVVHDRAERIDPDKRTVTVAGGGELAYDRLVMAPGIDFKPGAVDGYDTAAEQVMPHAYKADAQVAVLRRRLEAMDDGGTFVISSPKRPYRCPPAPYERAAMAAHYFKRAKPKSKVLILDSKDEFPMSEPLSDVWAKFYGDMIEWVPAEFGGRIRAVDVKTLSLISDDDSFEGDVVNVIPDQQAARIAEAHGLTDAGGWCPVDGTTFESRLVPGIHVIGDAIDPGDMTKSAYAANNHAIVCAAAVNHALTGRSTASPQLNATCFFLVAPDQGVKIGGVYEATDAGIAGVSGFVSAPGEDDETRRETAIDGDVWYDAVIKDMFG